MSFLIRRTGTLEAVVVAGLLLRNLDVLQPPASILIPSVAFIHKINPFVSQFWCGVTIVIFSKYNEPLIFFCHDTDFFITTSMDPPLSFKKIGKNSTQKAWIRCLLFFDGLSPIKKVSDLKLD